MDSIFYFDTDTGAASLEAFCCVDWRDRVYQHRRLVVTGWILGLVVIFGVGSSIGSAFSTSFSSGRARTKSGRSRPPTSCKRAFPAEAGDVGQIVFADEHGVQGGTTKQHMTTLLADVARVPGVASVVSPYDAVDRDRFPTTAGSRAQDGAVRQGHT